MVVFAGQGDPRRSMDLLWRAPGGTAAGPSRPGPRPGPRPQLSVDLIVDAAIGVADTEGMAALSMRAVGERLGRTAMALYTYVPGKAELVDLMYDRAQAELPPGYDTGAGWRAAVTAWAEDTWAFYLRHPWMLAVSQARPVLGPGEYRALEALLEALSGAALEPGDLRRAVATLSSVVRGAARTAAEAREAAAATGATEDEWWHARSGALADTAPDFAARFPRVAELSAAGAFDDEAFEAGTPAAGEGGGFALYQERAAREAFAGGLALVLDGIEAAAARR
ncbi:TetR/AcrR family transcriptional regulator [Actinomadura sp. WMMB 499]|uniref:TetR/AcrR family transcriptional regulator n=1 Tax=Actinomadura sp. WMMB 499 TaxID=1219491 RepID=UPI0012459CE1|nr:TetR/AcrR family transcriptional regulator C-terminal domain-containing protein [Actinomadura sp. WMMB 499]QFG26730.1 TetR/AcrR family transcriptional regulator [Actinomadura sp. WMMB 499]